MSLDAQRQIRENTAEAQDFLRDLHKWQKEMKTQHLHKPSQYRTPPRRPQVMELCTLTPKQPHDMTKDMQRHNPSQLATQSRQNGDTRVDREGMDTAKKAEDCRTKGNACYRVGDYGRAIEWYSESIEMDRTCFSYANRAMAYLKIKQFMKAEQDCDAAVELDSGFLKAYQRRSAARKEQGKCSEALDDAEMALRLNPTSDVIRSTFHELLNEMMTTEQLSLDKQPIHITPPSDPEPISVTLAPTLAPDGRVSVTANASTHEDSVKEIQVNGRITEESSDNDQEETVSLPPVPKTWTQFEAGYKALRDRPDVFSLYLSSIKPSDLPSVFKASLSTPVLESVLVAVMFGIGRRQAEIDEWIAFLEQLQSVPRYDMLTMCLTKKQKESLRQHWEQESGHITSQLKTKLEPFLKAFL